MSKVIRTARIARPVVTLGEAERDLYEEEGQQGGIEALGLEGLVEQQVLQMRRELEALWEERLRREKDYLQGEANKRMQEAEARWRAEREQLYRQRYEEGHQAGLAEREAEARQAVERLAALHGALVEERGQILKEAEESVVDLAVALARRVVGIQAEVDPKVLARVARNALEQLSGQSNLEVRVNPGDWQVARRFLARWAEKADQDAALKVRPSDKVGRGGCMIEGSEENIDARLEEQFRVLHQALRAALEGQRQTGAAEGAQEGGQGDEPQSSAGDHREN